MEFIIGCLIFAFICYAIAGLIDDSQSNDAEKIKEEFLEDIENICIENNIKFQEPDSVKITLPNNFGYKYEYTNAVSLSYDEKSMALALYWIDTDSNDLHFVGRNNSFTISLDKIEMYTFNGEVEYISKVKNYGKNISLSGAILGGVVAGPAGMAIGATKDRNNIDTEIEEKDNRKVYVYFRNANDEIEMFSVEKSFFSQYFSFDKFITKNLPTKSDTYLIAHESKNDERNSNINDIESSLVQLKRMFENNLISEEEYNNKKQQLLDKF